MPLQPVPPPPVVEYWAISLFSSRTFWVNTAFTIIAILSASDVISILPARFVPFMAAFVSIANIVLRTQTVRPVALIAPGAVMPITVKRIEPPPPTVGEVD